MFNNFFFFFFENRAVCEIMWKNVDGQIEATDDNITRCMRFACRITQARIQSHTWNI